MSITEKVYSFKTGADIGFTSEEMKDLLTQFPPMDMDKFYDALSGITCAVVDGKTRIYHCDIITAIKCGIEKRNIRLAEWD